MHLPVVSDIQITCPLACASIEMSQVSGDPLEDVLDPTAEIFRIIPLRKCFAKPQLRLERCFRIRKHAIVECPDYGLKL